VTSRRILVAVTGTAALAAVLPAQAPAATKTVYEGMPQSAQKKFAPTEADSIDFFPHTVTIHVGDSVKFVPTAFHNVDIPKRGGKATALLSLGTTVSGAVDTAGSPWWFNGLPNVGFNSRFVEGNPTVDYSPFKKAAGAGKQVTYTGAKEISSPIPFNAGPKPLTVKFAKAGTITYFCPLHEGMKGVVRVLPKSRPIPSAKADAKALQKQIDATYAIARTLKSSTVPANTIDVGYAGAKGVEYFGFLPKTTTVPVGTTVTFQITPKSLETHTATTGPGIPEQDASSYLGQIASSFFQRQFHPAGVYASQPAGEIAQLTKTLHGDGFWNSGVLAPPGNALNLISSNKVTFSAPGTYEFWCMVHPQMHGTVIAQ
jgi:plastocyanin